jgi:hypothetical protein
LSSFIGVRDRSARRFASVDEDVQTRPNLGLQIWKASANELADTDSNWRR